MSWLKAKLYEIQAIWGNLPDGLRRFIHTSWQVGAGAFLAYLTANLADIGAEDILTVIYASLLAAIKAVLLHWRGNQR